MQSTSRVQFSVRGVVQGVGFRPFVHRLAVAHGLAGEVSNRGAHVHVDVEGPRAALDAFARELRGRAPAAARVDEVVAVEAAPGGRSCFRVVESATTDEGGELPPDLGPCDDCLRELADPSSRHVGHPFTTCTACGPRYTVIRGLPYDRPRTALAPFAMCDACAAEHRDPAHRRYHVEAQACRECGPRLALSTGDERVVGPEALARARALVEAGGILALKGVGGYQLACLPRGDAVARLRARKRRPHKPLALCARDLAQVELVASLPPGAAEALRSPARPIVLLPLRPGALADGVAPGLAHVGVMLPASPLHVLLLEGASSPWVLTSGNAHGRPIAIDDAVAREELAEVADGFLSHDRAIVARADDSVVQLHRGRPRALRRARGFAPRSIALPVDGPDVVALGADLKATVCVTRGARAFVSPHVGDLGDPATEGALREALQHLLRVTGARPVAAGCDLHPDYVSARVARELGLPLVPVQHHHAHAAACLVEHGRTGPALALALDGTGYGADDTPWGGELLVADLHGSRRVGRLRPVALPGGDRAAREPWRCALAHLLDAGLPPELEGVEPARAALVRDMIARGVNSPRASSAGRLFDAVAALLGLRLETTYEGQAAQELEATAAPFAGEAPYPLPVAGGEDLLELDTRPLIRAVAADRAAGAEAGRVSARFHAGLAAGLVAGVERARQATGLSLVVLTGGVFQNLTLLAQVEDALARLGFEVLTPYELPAGDGGISLGQAAVAREAIRGRPASLRPTTPGDDHEAGAD